MTVGNRDRGVRRLREPESMRTDTGLSRPLPNVWRQWRAGEAGRVHCTPGLGTGAKAYGSEEDGQSEPERIAARN